jgi:hypothetical protein
MKNYPLNIEVCAYDEVSIHSRGHHDFDVFNATAKPYLEDFQKIQFNAPIHTWWRVIPDGEEGCYIAIAKSHSRGAYPVTVIEQKF